MSAQLTSAQEEQLTNQNSIGVQLQSIIPKIEEMDKQIRLDVQRTDRSEKILLEISSVVATRTQENVGNNAQNQTMGAVEGQGEIGPDARNLGLRLKMKRRRKRRPKLLTPLVWRR